MADRASVLDLAAELERRDREVAAALEQVQRLDRWTRSIRERARKLQERIDSGPAELAALDVTHAQARADRERAVADLAAAETAGAADEDARRALERARRSDAEASSRLDRIAAERRVLETGLASAREESAALVREAGEASGELGGLDQVSATGREAPGPRLDGLPDWGSRVHAALLVVRGRLEQERERLVREAGELGGAVLGEELAGANVALVRRRLEEALGP